MSELEVLKSKLDKDINIEKIVERLLEELNIDEEKLYIIIMDVVIMILDYTNQERIEFLQTTTLVNMIKDYFYFNKLDNNSNVSGENSDDNELKIKSISIGDTTTTFSDKLSQFTINGITYSTGTIEFNKNVLIEKYSNELNKYRKLRW